VGAAPLFIKTYPPGSESIKDWGEYMASLPRDRKATEQWLRTGDRIVADVVADPGVSEPVREAMEWNLFSRDFRFDTMAFIEKRKQVDWSAYLARFERHERKYRLIADETMAARAMDYLSALKSLSPDEAKSAWSYLAHAAGRFPLRSAAEAQLAVLQEESGDKPLEMKFKSIDGRDVDVAALRGKVVLVDFWATWCKPCVAELPHLKSMYEKYNAQGFEIIGISMDDENHRARVAALLKEAGLSWPQRFEGKGYDQDTYRQMYGISGLPTTFFLNQEGKIVSKQARGDVLEALIRQHVGLD
jgi:thiol-disulfide isomerase/thioredoxin